MALYKDAAYEEHLKSIIYEQAYKESLQKAQQNHVAPELPSCTLSHKINVDHVPKVSSFCLGLLMRIIKM